MIVTLGILCVDGETHLGMTGDLIAARQFLKDQDHEGSSLSVKIEAHNEEVYELLKDREEVRKMSYGKPKGKPRPKRPRK